MKRFLIEKVNSDVVQLAGSEHNHLRNVLRLNDGEQVILNCGDGFDYIATIKNVAKNYTILHIDSKQVNGRDSKCDVTVFQAIVKGDNMSLIVQKCTELGVKELVPFTSKFITAKDKEGKSDKLQLISNQSTKQCKRSIPMKVANTLSFDQMLSTLKNFDVVIFANECENTTTLNAINPQSSQKVAIIVGSEGGFSEDEIAKIINAGAHSITMGKRILRAETATIALASVVMYLLGEWTHES